VNLDTNHSDEKDSSNGKASRRIGNDDHNDDVNPTSNHESEDEDTYLRSSVITQNSSEHGDDRGKENSANDGSESESESAYDYDSPINAVLATTSLLDKPRYIALSYTWGDPFYGYQARNENQRDLEERSNQVLPMGELYREAALVMSWLGEDSRMPQGLQVMEELGRRFGPYSTEALNSWFPVTLVKREQIYQNSEQKPEVKFRSLLDKIRARTTESSYMQAAIQLALRWQELKKRYMEQ
jgi:Heterokaryon incompatibility protein (HET).